MNYEIIKDKEFLLDFIDWLPELEPHETYVVNLFARNKYSKEIVHINSDKAQMKRFAATKDWLFRKIKQLETEVGTYWQNQIPIPQDALALYITPNPRSQELAAKNMLKVLADLITRGYSNYNIAAEALSQLQKATSRKIYFTLDVDFDPFFKGMSSDRDEVSRFLSDVMTQAMQSVNAEALTFLRTRGGVHVLVDLTKIHATYKNTWYKEIIKIPGVDVKGANSLIPVPGCTQGNFIPYFI